MKEYYGYYRPDYKIFEFIDQSVDHSIYKRRNNFLGRNNINASYNYGLVNVKYGLANISCNFSMLLRTGSLPNTKTIFSFTIPYSLELNLFM